MKNKKVNILCQYFYPDVASTGQLMTELSVELAKLGMNVHAYTTKPAYYQKKDALEYEIYNGISIYRVFCFNANKNKGLFRVLNEISFSISIFIKLLFTERKAVNFIVSNPPILHFVGYFLKILRRQNFVLLVYDLYPDLPIALNYIKKNSMIANLWNRIYQKAFINSSKTIALSNGMKQKILDKFENPYTVINEKIEIIHNWANNEFFHFIPKEENIFIKKNNLSDKFILLYSGNIALFNEFESILKSSLKVVNDTQILYLFIGNGGKRKEIEQFVQEHPEANIKIMNYQLYEDLPYSISSGDISFVTVKNGVNGINMPSKLYTIMACGKPIIALGDKNGDVHQMLELAKCGIFIEQNDVDSLVKAICFYKNNPDVAKEHGLNGRKYFEENYTFKIISNKYFNLLRDIE
jgi:glycosyltransferase involved in cell wall biosynthesis